MKQNKDAVVPPLHPQYNNLMIANNGKKYNSQQKKSVDYKTAQLLKIGNPHEDPLKLNKLSSAKSGQRVPASARGAGAPQSILKSARMNSN